MRVALAVIVVSLFAGVSAAQTPAPSDSEDALTLTRTLYASASYAEALAALERNKDTQRPEEQSELERYQALCLLALGRTEDAERVIETLVTRDPLYRLDPTDAAPRVRTTFASVRRRVLPGVARGLYAEGKRAYDRKAFDEAAEKFDRALQLLAEPDAESEGVDDLQTLAAGFLDLSRTAMRAAAGPKPPASAATPAPPSPSAAPAIAAPPATFVTSATEPVVLQQEVPKWTFSLAAALYEAEFRGTIEVDIDEVGNVVAARILKPIHPGYDPLLLQAALQWKYLPGTLNGKAVRTQKRIDINLRPR